MTPPEESSGRNGWSERRSHPRHPIRLKVEYQSLGSFVQDYAINISRGGLFVGSERPPEVGTVFELRLHVPSLPGPFRIQGEVAWLRSTEEAVTAVKSLLGQSLVTPQTGPDGIFVHQVLLEEGVDIDRELYLGMVMDRQTARPAMIFMN